MVVLTLMLAALPWTPERKTVLNYTARFLVGRARTDSWGQMHVALAYFRAHPDRPLYSDVFGTLHIRFPYAPPSLFLTAVVERLPVDSIRLLNGFSWLAVWVTMAITAALFARASGVRLDIGGLALIGAFGLTFFPLLRGFTLGQIQTILDMLLAMALLAWVSGRPALAGALAALPCLVKPQYGLLLLWGVSRRRWAFSATFAGMLGLAGIASLVVFGWQNHLDYVRMLAYIARHGESYYTNNSVNGLLHRLLHNGDNLAWHEDRYPPFNGWVYAGTLTAAAALIGTCLLWRRRDHLSASGIDLMIAILTAVMASPVAWQHHYGVALAIYAAATPGFLGRRVFGAATPALVAVSYVLVASVLGLTNLCANTRWNIVQSYLLAGAGLLLLGLYRLRSADATSRGDVGAAPISRHDERSH